MATRNERVVLTLDDHFTTPMARSAAATALLNRELDHLSGSSTQVQRTLRPIANQDIPALGRSADRTGNQIDRMSGRLRILADVAASIGPALVPIGGAGIAALSGLANQLGVAALAGGSAIIAFQGVGEALKAMGDAEEAPTRANLEKVQQQMDKLSPAARQLSKQLFGLRDEWDRLQDAGAKALFPGVSGAIDALEARVPDVNRIVRHINSTLGSLLEDAGESLAGDQWDDFFDFLATDATETLRDLGVTIGHLTHGFAELWMAFAPLNSDFGDFLTDIAKSFDGWAAGLAQTDGFIEFVDYVRNTAPQVGETLSSLANALLQVVEATAPLGGPVLHILETFADIIATIADSGIGTPVLVGLAALGAYNRALAITGTLTATTWGTAYVGRLKTARTALGQMRAEQNATRLSLVEMSRASALATRTIVKGSSERAVALRGGAASIAKGAALLGGLALASTGAADGIGLTNTASLALMGTIAGPLGAALGGAVGLTLDLAAANNRAEDAIRAADAALRSDASVTELREKLHGLASEADRLANANPFTTAFAWLSGADEDLAAKGEEVRVAIETAANATGDITDILQGSLRPELGRTREAFHESAESADEFRQSLEGVNALLDERGSLRAYQQAIRDAGQVFKDRADVQGEISEARKQLAEDQAELDRATTPSARRSAKDQIANDLQRIRELQAALKELSTDLDRATDQGSENEARLDAIAQAALRVAENIKDRGGDPSFILDRARTEFIRVAKSFGMSRDAARALADDLHLLNRTVAEPTIAPKGVEASEAKITRLDRKLDRLTKGYLGTGGYQFQVTADITQAERQLARLTRKLVAIGAQNIPVGIRNPNLIEKADGGTVPGQRRPYADKILMLAAPGEEVISNRYGQADRFRRDRSAGRIPGYADGGTVGMPDTATRPHSVTSWSHTTNHYASAPTPAGRSYAGMFDGATFKHNDLRESIRQGQQIAVLVDGGGVAFG